jgi:predicted SAM-dependent methyltransferase
MNEAIRIHKADLGCGWNKKQGFCGVDIDASFNPDVCCDLTKEFPFGPDCLDEVYSSHFLEHIPADKVKVVMDSIAVSCINGAKVEIKVPLNFKDPSHQQILGYDWIRELMEIVPKTMVLWNYRIEIIHTTSILPHEMGKPFSYEQATIVFKVRK